MHLASKASFLVVHDVPGINELKLSVAPSLADALTGWTKASRLSPIWRLADEVSSGEGFALPATCQLTFVGPVRAGKLLSEIDGIRSAASLWATLGCFNVIVCTKRDLEGDSLADAVTAWARKVNVAFEQWTLQDQEIVEMRHYVLPPRTNSVLPRMLAYERQFRHPAVRSGFEEHLVASATALSRASAIYPAIYDEIETAVNSIVGVMELRAQRKLSLHDLQSRLLTMNAALSRFSSQAFSGIPPIISTECHFWVHSLLGTGSANIALASLVSSVQKVLGEARLPERLRMLAAQTDNVPSSEDFLTKPQFLDFDILQISVDSTLDNDPIIPLVTYFSGRDGFSSHINTLSAPLTTLAECNSFRSNLLTVTHEISHIFIQSALAELSPTPGVDADMRAALLLVAPHAVAKSWLEAAQQLFLEAIINIATFERGGRVYSHKELGTELINIVEHTRSEAQEIMVHTFDFIYFHASDPSYYITSIWHSWCSIPGIRDRIPEYLLRTMCAVSSTLLRNKATTRFAAVLHDVKRELASFVSKIDMDDNYVAHTLALIDSLEKNADAYAKFQMAYSVRMRLVRLVYIFLYSERLSARLFSDPHRGRGEGYLAKKPLFYDLQPVGNALQFLKIQLKATPTEAESMWVLHALAFDLTPPPLEAS